MTAIRTIADTVPDRTLGWEMAAWSANYIVQPDGAHAGEPFEFTGEQLRILLRWYSLDDRGRFVYRRGVLRRCKGWGKDPVGAAIALFELCGPCRFAGWGADGQAIGEQHPAALVQIAAVSQFQTKSTMSLLPAMLSAAAYDDYGIEPAYEIMRAGNGGRVEAVTASPRSLEGARPSFVLMNETEHWLASNQGVEMARVIARNLAKSRDGASRSLELANAHLVGEESVAEQTHGGWEKAAGMVAGLMYDSLEAPAIDLADPAAVAEAVEIARGDSWWLDAERVVAEVLDPTTRATEARRFFLNQLVGIDAEASWLPTGAWDANAAPGPVPDGARVVLGFDGSLNNDSTALVVVAVGEKPHVDVVAAWERPERVIEDWRVPVGEVMDTMRAACQRWKVVEIAADPSRWVHELEVLDGEGLPIVEFPQSRQRMVPATQRLYEAVTSSAMTHSGDPRLARHVRNAVRRPDGQLAKVSRHSPRKIDLAVAAVMAFDRAATTVTHHVTVARLAITPEKVAEARRRYDMRVEDAYRRARERQERGQ